MGFLSKHFRGGAWRLFLIVGVWVILSSRLIAGENQWTPSGPPGHVTAIASDAPLPYPPPPSGYSPTLYAVTAAGFFQSHDLGQTWKVVNVEMSSARIHAIAADPATPGRVTGVGCGAYRSDDWGVTWTSLSRGLPEACLLERLDIDIYRSERLFASGPGGLYITDFDGTGVYWRPSGQGLFDGPIVVAAHPYSRSGVGRLFAAPETGGFFVSEDWGASWNPTPGGPAGASVYELGSDEYSHLSALTSKGFYWSGDAGRTWIPASPQMPDLGATSQIVLSWVSYAATDTGVFRNAGGWRPFSEGLPDGTGIARVFASTTGRLLCAAPVSGPGTFVYRYGSNPVIRLTPVPAALFVGFNPDLHVEITLEQPEAVVLALQSSDATVLEPFGFAYVMPFTTSLAFPFFIRRASDHLVTIKVSEQLGGTSSAATVSVLNGVPQKLYVDPQVVPSGGGSFTLHVFSDNLGRAFVEGSTILWNGSPRPTSFQPAGVCPGPCNTGIQATIPAEDVASPGAVKISVRNPPPGGGTSDAVTLIVGPRPRSTLVRSPRSRPPVRLEKPRG